jgi:signal transduction histidine kinase
VRRILPRLIEAIDRAVALCTRTLDFSRSDPAPLTPSRFLLARLIEEVGAGLAPAEGFALDAGVPPDFEVEADRDQFYRIVSNLARNAVEAGARRLQVLAMREDGTIVIEIADDGPGLPAKARDNLFRPFFGSGRPGGSGLGLAIARELTRAHGGDLALVSTSVAGARFRITLPAPAARRTKINRETVSPT